MEQEKNRGNKNAEALGREASLSRPARRSRKRKRRNHPLKLLLLLLLCVMLAGAGWGLARLGQTMLGSGGEETETLESSREVTPETFPESGAETFL